MLEARRVELPHGTLALVRATVVGFKALPVPPGTKTWRELLGVAATERNMATMRAAFKRLASAAHPDKGGTHQTMADLNAALVAAEKALS
ncbi:hypothetical protein LJR029_007045 [Caballeronia sp. LjRoot29]|uniref:hypothetical protein n=1 Tax=Caballeronia sp. LjRoot29 TaxID=3342315 RepID=UPI003ED0DCFE